MTNLNIPTLTKKKLKQLIAEAQYKFDSAEDQESKNDAWWDLKLYASELEGIK